MDPWAWIVLAVAIVLALMFALRAGGRRALIGVDPTQLSLDPALMTQVRVLAQSDRKIEAIRLLRSSTPGLSLLSARTMVDRMAAAASGLPVNKGPVDPGPADFSPIDLSQGPVDLSKGPADGLGAAVDRTPSTVGIPLEVELEVRSLKSEGKTIPAIKAVREATGMGLREAKDYVDGL